MRASERRKKADKEARSRTRQEAQKRLDGRDRQINTKLPDEENAVHSRELASGTTDTDRAVTAGHMKGDILQSRHFENLSVPARALQNNIVDEAKCSSEIKGGSQDNFALRKIAGTGSATTVSASNHTHSSKNWKRDFTSEERRQALGWRRTVEGLADEDLEAMMPGLSALKNLALNVFSQLADERDERWDDVEDRLETDEAFRHEHLMKNDPVYYARWMAEYDPQYRREMVGTETLNRELAAWEEKKREGYRLASLEALEREKV